MKIDRNLTDDALPAVIGERLAALRLARNLTQQKLAEETGLGLRTVQRLELGLAATQLSGFLRVCRVLGLIERLDLLIPEPAASPMAQMKSQGRKRTQPTVSKTWEWGKS